MMESNDTKIPMDPGTKLVKAEDGNSVDATYYRSLIGSLRYLLHTRPDLSYSVGLLTRFMQDPKDHHLKAIKQIFHEVALHLKSLSEIAQSLLLPTIYELEPDAIDVILAKVTIPVYVIGPNIPDFQLQRNMPSDESSYVSWLDSKPQRSVLYVSLGSQLLVSSAQIDELLEGLKQSGVDFLWAARDGKNSRLSGDCGSNGFGGGLV
ncbi:hypothetical protein Tco_1340387 [Tanacetum coccineum]